jgi:hypothetical protein
MRTRHFLFLPAMLLMAACVSADPTAPELPGMSVRASSGVSGSEPRLSAPLSSPSAQPAAMDGDSTSATGRGLMFGSGT